MQCGRSPLTSRTKPPLAEAPVGAKMSEVWIIDASAGKRPSSLGLPPIGGSVNRRRMAWRAKQVSAWALRILKKGAPTFFDPRSPPPKVFHNPKLSPQKQAVIDGWISEALAQCMIETTTWDCVKVVSPIFVIPKKTPGQFRLIFDLRYVNRYQKVPTQRYPDLKTIRFMILPQDWMSSVDLKEGFALLEASEELKPFLGFRWRGILYRYRVLPFGLRSSPWVFNKMLAQTVATLRRRGIRLIVYVDDFLILARSRSQSIHHTRIVIQELTRLGWRVNMEKSELEPSQRAVFLGTLLDSNAMTIALPSTKKRLVAHELRRFVKKASKAVVPKRIAARILGLVTSISPCLRWASAFARRLMGDMNKAPHWDSSFAVANQSLEDLLLLADLIASSQGEPLVDPDPAWTMRTDASSVAWGAWKIDSDERISAPWPQPHANSSNHCELKAVHLALKQWAHLTQPGQVIAIESDNTTTIAYLKRLHGRVPALNTIARKILNICQSRQIRIVPSYVPGELNTVADYLSRRNHEWSISPTAFQKTVQALSPSRPPTVDRFASQQYHHLPQWNHLGDSALKHPWSGTQNYWAPPLPLLSRTIRKIVEDKASGILITPAMPSKWLPTCLHLSSRAIRFPTKDNTLGESFALSSEHMVAWLISGTPDCPNLLTDLDSFWFRIENSPPFTPCFKNSEHGF